MQQDIEPGSCSAVCEEALRGEGTGDGLNNKRKQVRSLLINLEPSTLSTEASKGPAGKAAGEWRWHWRFQPGLHLNPGIPDLWDTCWSVFHGGGPSEAAVLCVRCRAEGLERSWVGSKRVLVLLLLPGLCGRSSWCAKTRDGLWNAPGLGTAGLQAAIHTNVSLPGPLLSSHCSPRSVFWSRV